MIQPAICEIDKCGVLAIGRCATCGRAFCGSHEAFDNLHIGFIANMCTPCLANTPEQIEDSKSRAHYEKINKARDYFDSGAARKDLLKSGVPCINLYRTETENKWEKIGFLGLEKHYVPYEKIVMLDEGCWYIGDFVWSLSYHNYNDALAGDINKIETWKTAMRNWGKGEIFRVKSFKDGYLKMDEFGYIQWDVILAEQEVKRLAKQGNKK